MNPSNVDSRLVASEIRELSKFASAPGLISFAAGIPDPNLLPIEDLRRAYNRILSDELKARVAFQYSITEGYVPLREQICQYMALEGVNLRVDNILITNGAQQGLDFVGRLLINPGECVVVSEPSYLGALQTFAASGANFIPVPSDEEGMIIDSVLDALERHPKFIYLVSDFANPSSNTTSFRRRTQLVDIASRYEIPIVEDGAYSWLRYEGEKIKPVISIDAHRRSLSGDAGAKGNVIYLGTFSKIVAPALRIGWLALPDSIIEKFVLLKQSSDLHSSTINQMVMAEVISAIIPSYVKAVLPVYKSRRDAMLKALNMYFPMGSEWTVPAGGFFIWVELPAHMDAEQLLRTSFSRLTGVTFVPGCAFYTNRSGRNKLRLSFSTASMDQIDAGIKLLGQHLAQC